MIYRAALIAALLGASRTVAQNGCLDSLDPNYDSGATFDDGTQCSKYCWENDPKKLTTQIMPRWLGGEVQKENLFLAVQASQKYPITWVSLLSPATVSINNDSPTRRFEMEFTEHGRVSNSPSNDWSVDYTEQCWNDYSLEEDWFDVYLPNSPQSSSLVRTDYPDTVDFQGYVEIRSFEDIPDIRDQNLTRWITSLMTFNILFHSTVAFTTGDIDVIDEYNVMYAIIEQSTVIVDPEADPPTAEADVVLFTTIQWPFELVNPRIAVNDNQLAVAIQMLEDCADPGAANPTLEARSMGVEACNRRYHIDVTILGQKCDFTADYTAVFDIACADSIGAGDCPLKGGETSSVVFNLESENVCPILVEEVHSFGYARTYKSARVGTQEYTDDQLSTGFMKMQRAFFEIGVNVAELSDDLIAETTITSIDLCLDVACSSPAPLYAAGSPATFFEPDLMLQVEDYARVAGGASPLPRYSDIQFTLHPSVFPVPLDSSLTFWLQIGLDVEYTHTAGGLLEDSDGKSVEKRIENIRVGAKRPSAKAGPDTKTHKNVLLKRHFLMQEGDTNSIMIEAGGSIANNPDDYPNANDRPPAIDDMIGAAENPDMTGGASSLRAGDHVARIVVTCVVAACMTALAW